MNPPDNSSDQQQLVLNENEFSQRERVAQKLPFSLRAWWMRDHQQSEDLTFGMFEGLTAPLDCLHSDPLCDVGNLDSVLP